MRACTIRRVPSICLAPPLSVAIITIMAIILRCAGIYANILSMMLLPCLLLLGVALLTNHHRPAEKSAPFEIFALALYCLCGIAAGWYLYLNCLASPDSFLQTYDMVFHSNLVRSFADSGSMSPLNVNPYMSSADAAIDPFPAKDFYPAAWHCITALTVQATGVSVPTAINATQFSICSLLFPCGIFALLSSIFKNRPSVTLFGAIAGVCVAIFPWEFVEVWPLPPNLLALSLLPATVVLFVVMTRQGLESRKRIKYAVIFCFALIGMTLSQPNAAFSAAVFLIPYCIYSLPQSSIHITIGKHTLPPWVSALLFGIACCILWCVLYSAPPLQAVIQYEWPAYTGIKQAFINCLTLSYTNGFPLSVAIPAQIVPAIFVFIGIIRTLTDRKYLWLSFSYGFACLICCATAVSNGFISHFLSGFWYTDPMRVGAMAGIFSIPLLAYGIDSCLCVLMKLRGLNIQTSDGQELRQIGLPCTVIAVLVAMGTFHGAIGNPESPIIESPFDTCVANGRALFESNYPLSNDEMSFITEVLASIPKNSLVINTPLDGSAIAYSTCDIRVYYRFIDSYNTPAENKTSYSIRSDLNDIATNAMVSTAVEDTGASYVLKLHDASSEPSYPSLATSSFKGIAQVTDTTPGFELILADGDMRLYRIITQ